MMDESHLFSSSPARPSHHRTQLPIKPSQDGIQLPGVFPASSRTTATGAVNPRKRSASRANLLTPPVSPAKARHRSGNGFASSEEEDDDAEQEDELESSGGGRVLRPRKSRAATKPGRTTKVTGGKTSFLEHVSRSMGSKQQPEAVMKQVDKMNLESPVTPGKRTGDAMEVERSPVSTLQRPTTPTPSSRKTRGRPGPIRDSPNNPFLGPLEPRTPVPKESLAEKPTVTYVFRGVKAVFRNPAYGIPEPVPGSVSTLPPEHPDFSPDLITAPKLLWPSSTSPDSDEDVSPRPRRTRAGRLSRSPERMVSSSPVRQRDTNKRRRLMVRKDGDLLVGHKTPKAAVQ